MAWHHHVHHAVSHGIGTFAERHPWMTFILVGTGISALANVAIGQHGTPAPSQQNKTPATPATGG